MRQALLGYGLLQVGFDQLKLLVVASEGLPIFVLQDISGAWSSSRSWSAANHLDRADIFWVKLSPVFWNSLVIDKVPRFERGVLNLFVVLFC